MSMLELFLIPACFYAAVSDFLFYRIPNWLVLSIIIAYIIKSFALIFMGASFDILIHPGITFGISLLVGFILFYMEVLGAGDAKLIAACSLWMADINPINYIMLVAICGGILATFYLIFKNPLAFIRQLLLSKIVDKNGGATLIIKEENMVPYAIAVFSGVVWMVLRGG